MEITINNKKYIGKYNEYGRLILPLDNDNDKQFFIQWVNQNRILYLKKIM